GYVDAFVAKFDANCFLERQTYYGGNYYDYAYSIGLGGSMVAITGLTGSTTLPTTPHQYNQYSQANNAGLNDAFVAAFSTDLLLLNYATYFGGSGEEKGLGISVTLENGFYNFYIAGVTSSSTPSDSLCQVPGNNGFPLCNANGQGYFQSTYGG